MIRANFPQEVNYIESDPLTQWDKYQKLLISGLGVTGVYQVHFCTDASKQAKVRMAYPESGGHAVEIPNTLLQEGRNIFAYIYLTTYEVASVDAATDGEYFTLNSGVYTKKTLPREYKAGVTYYKQTGATFKTVKILVKPRKKPDDYIDAGDPTDEELIEELIRYCNNLGYRLDYYTSLVNQYRSKDLVQLVSKAEYDALVAAGKVESGVIYVIREEDTIAVIIENVRLAVSEGINSGEIAVTQCEDARKVNGIALARSGEKLKIGDIIIPQRKIIWTGTQRVTNESGYTFNFDESVVGRTFELEYLSTTTGGINDYNSKTEGYEAPNFVNKIIKFKVKGLTDNCWQRFIESVSELYTNETVQKDFPVTRGIMIGWDGTANEKQLTVKPYLNGTPSATGRLECGWIYSLTEIIE